MELDRLDRVGLVSLDAAVRRGEPVRLGAGARAALPMDEIVPFCHAVADPALAKWLPPASKPGSGIAVSVVIPTHRARPIGLATLAAQDVDVETVVLANGAFTEGIRVPWEGHGLTRRRGVALVRHPYVLFTVDDALPLGAGFLRTLVEALEDGGYDAVYARQLPWPTSDAVTRARLRTWTPAGQVHGPGSSLDNVAALYRTQALVDDPFDNVPIAEDWHWGRRHRVGYVPTAAVAHAHPRRFRTLFERTRDIHRERIRAGEPASVPDLGTLVRGLPSVLGPDLRGALGELLGQYVAGR
jgi:hypothetical protein